MGLLRFLVWTSCAVGLGIFLATYKHQGRTPLEHAERLWHQHAPAGGVEGLGDSVRDAWEDARDTLSADRPTSPRERHSPEDKRALERLISRRGAKSTP